MHEIRWSQPCSRWSPGAEWPLWQQYWFRQNICICIYVCIYVCMHACMHICMHLFMQYVYVCMHLCICALSIFVWLGGWPGGRLCTNYWNCERLCTCTYLCGCVGGSKKQEVGSEELHRHKSLSVITTNNHHHHNWLSSNIYIHHQPLLDVIHLMSTTIHQNQLSSMFILFIRIN